MPSLRTLAMTLLLAGGLLLTACGGDTTAPASGTESAAPAPQVLEVVAKDLSFEPTTLTATAGQPVMINLVNEGALEHDWSVGHGMTVMDVMAMGDGASDAHTDEMAGMEEDLALHMSAEAGHSAEMTFTPSEAGTYEFYCTVLGHKEAGMVGTLIIN